MTAQRRENDSHEDKYILKDKLASSAYVNFTSGMWLSTNENNCTQNNKSDALKTIFSPKIARLIYVYIIEISYFSFQL